MFLCACVVNDGHTFQNTNQTHGVKNAKQKFFATRRIDGPYFLTGEGSDKMMQKFTVVGHGGPACKVFIVRLGASPA
jgi:hypothetical protein